MLNKNKLNEFLDEFTPKLKEKNVPITPQKETEKMMLPFIERRNLYLKGNK